MLFAVTSTVLSALFLATNHVHAQSTVTVPVTIDRTGWSASADSQQTGSEASKILDGSTSSIWQTQSSPLSPLPHNLTLDMKNTFFVTGLTYLPRQDASNDGNIGQHTILVSDNGISWTTLSTGTWSNDKQKKTSFFTGVSGRYVRLMAQSEASATGKQLTTAAEINVLTAPRARLSRENWVVKADSSEGGAHSYLAQEAVDGAVTSYWQSQLSGGTLPHYFTIDQGAAKAVAGLTYLPRPASTGSNGNIGNYSIERSTDGITWTNVVSGTWPDNAKVKTAGFAAVSSRYFRLVALTEAGNRGPWTSASEINLLDGSNQLANFKVTVDSQESNNAADQALDDNTGTFWITQAAATYPHYITIDMQLSFSVFSLTYVPRQDGSPNGRIGDHKIETSTDGKVWSQVASGEFRDWDKPSLVNFEEKIARFVRLTALSEAGGRVNWASAAEITLGYDTSYVPPPASQGRWGQVIDFPTVPVAAAIVPQTGKVLVWSSYKADQFTGGSGSGKTVTATYDYVKGTVSQALITNTLHDMFCPGISIDFQGRPVVTGGNDAARTSRYEADTANWTALALMNIPRGYQSQATLSDGRIFVIGGSWSGARGGKDGEVYSSTTNTWTRLPGAAVTPLLTKDPAGVYKADNHPWLFPWSNGTIFQAGPSSAMNWYTTTNGGGVKAAGLRAADPDSMCGTVSMYDAVTGKIMSAGGSPAYSGTATTANTHLISIGAPNTTATVTKLTSMSYPRAYHNGIVLPNGQVLVVGGQTFSSSFTDDESVLHPELWDPMTQKWTVMAAMANPRNYHSTALLMPDATVISGGGGLCAGCSVNHYDMQVFSPPYLFNTDGSAATRPVISAVSPASVVLGGSLTVTTGGAVSGFSLVRMGSATHTVNTDQRRVPLAGTLVGTNIYKITVPTDPGVALPGYWMLFATSESGVPSLAKTVLVKPS